MTSNTGLIKVSPDNVKALIEYEGSGTDPYYYASEIELNPLHSHWHNGFLYISNAPQYPSNVILNVTPKSVGAGLPILATIRTVDDLGNPMPQELVQLSYRAEGQIIQLADVYTDFNGEAHYDFIPEKSGFVMARWGDLQAETEFNVVIPLYKQSYLCAEILPAIAYAGQKANILISLVDDKWRPKLGIVKLQYKDDNENDVTLNLNVNGEVNYLYTATEVKRTVQFDMIYQGNMVSVFLTQKGVPNAQL